METTDHRFKSVERKVGIFIWVAIIGMVALIAFIGIKQGIFTAKQTLYFFSDSGKDIKSGQTITLSGFKIGKVKNVLLEDITKVKVELSIYSNYMKWIKADAKAVLTKELPIGEGIIEIIPGSKGREEIGENGIIAFEKVPWFAAMTSNLDPIPITVVDSPQMAALISNLKENLKIEMAPVLEDFKHALKNLRKLSDESLETKDNVNSMLKNTDNALKNLEVLLAEFARELPIILKKTNITFDRTGEMIDEGIILLKGVKEVVDALKQTWPISSHIKKNAKKNAKKSEPKKVRKKFKQKP